MDFGFQEPLGFTKRAPPTDRVPASLPDLIRRIGLAFGTGPLRRSCAFSSRTRCVSARRSKGLWHLHLERSDGSLYSIRARALVNAAGPWVARFIQDALKQGLTFDEAILQSGAIRMRPILLTAATTALAALGIILR